MPAHHHGFEKTGRFGHLPFYFVNGAVFDVHMNIAVTFDPRNVMDVYMHGFLTHFPASGSRA